MSQFLHHIFQIQLCGILVHAVSEREQVHSDTEKPLTSREATLTPLSAGMSWLQDSNLMKGHATPRVFQNSNGFIQKLQILEATVHQITFRMHLSFK